MKQAKQANSVKLADLNQGWWFSTTSAGIGLKKREEGRLGRCIKTLVIPTGAGAHATAEGRNLLFLPFVSSRNRDELSTSNFPFRKT